MPIKDIIYLAAIAIIVGGFLLYRHSLIVDGEQVCLAREKAASDKQAVADTKITQDTTDALNAEISRLRNVAPADPTSSVARVQCYARPVSAPAGKPAAARPGEPAATGGSVPEVSPRARGGLDVGASLQRLAIAADLLSARNRACLKELQEP